MSIEDGLDLWKTGTGGIAVPGKVTRRVGMDRWKRISGAARHSRPGRKTERTDSVGTGASPSPRMETGPGCCGLRWRFGQPPVRHPGRFVNRPYRSWWMALTALRIPGASHPPSRQFPSQASIHPLDSTHATVAVDAQTQVHMRVLGAAVFHHARQNAPGRESEISNRRPDGTSCSTHEAIWKNLIASITCAHATSRREGTDSSPLLRLESLAEFDDPKFPHRKGLNG